MSYGEIYKITNIVNGKVYVGQTVRPLDMRWKEHLSHIKFYDFPLYRAIKKHGVKNFVVEGIDRAENREDLDAKERHWISVLQTMCPRGYNAISGPPGKATKTSEETKTRLSDGLRERWKTAEYRQKMKESTTGVKRGPRSEEWINKLSEAHRGKKLTEEHKEKIRLASKKLWEDGDYAARASLGLAKIHKQCARRVVNTTTGCVYESASEAARMCGLYQQNITKCCQGERKTVGGFEWEYAESGEEIGQAV